MANSSKLAESGPSSFSISSTASLPTSNLNNKINNNTKTKNDTTLKSTTNLSELTTTKSIHDQISASRNSKPNNNLKASKNDSSQTHSISSINSLKSSSDLGSIQFSVEYIQSLQQLKIHLISAINLPACDSNGLSDPYVKIHLLPGIAKVCL